MLNGRLHSVRALALGLAFVAVAFYAIVMPWRLTMHFVAEVTAAQNLASQNLASMGAPCSIALGLANEFDHGVLRHHERHAQSLAHDNHSHPHARLHHVHPHQGAAEHDPAPNPHFRCPLCKGLAAMQFVLLAVAQLGLLEPFGQPVVVSPTDDLPTELFTPVPQSRGPPFLS
jgi:hypothetical protein